MSTARLNEREIEALLDREPIRAEGLEELEAFIAALDRPTTPPADTFHMGTTLAAITRATTPQERRGSRRLAALGAMTAIFMATTGIAFAADASAPGDPLYRLDLAFESIGIGDGGLDERVVEYEVLIARGEDGLAQQLVDDVVAESAMAAHAFPGSSDDMPGEDRSDAIRQGRDDPENDDPPAGSADRGRDAAPGQDGNPGQGQENQPPSQSQGNQAPGENQGQGQENQAPSQSQGNQAPGENQGNQGQGQENQGLGQNQGNQGQPKQGPGQG